MNELTAAVTEYVALVTDLIGGWATTAALYGLEKEFERGSGQIKNYLAKIGCKDYEQRDKSTLLSTLPLPTNLVEFLTAWYSVKQIPDGRSIFCVPAQPSGLTPDEATSSPNAGKDVDVFKAQYNRILNIQGVGSGGGSYDAWPELSRILQNAGWTTYDFPETISVTRDGTWWDMQVENMAYCAGYSRNYPTDVQANPQAGTGRRTYALSVFGESLSPWIERLLMPVYTGNDSPDIWNRTFGFYNTAPAAGGAANGVTPISLGYYNFGSNYSSTSGAGFAVSRAQPAFLVVGNSSSTLELGWADSILGVSVRGPLATLYSEMAATLEVDSGSAYQVPSANQETGLYRKIFRGESTTVASNAYQFGNTIMPNMTGDGNPVRGTQLLGNQAALQQVYTAFLKP